MRVCARDFFGVGMEVVVGAGVGSDFCGADFWKKAFRRAHGGWFVGC